MLPAIAYPIHAHAGCSGASFQAVRGADRPVCALISALAMWSTGARMRGILTDADDTAVAAIFEEACLDAQIPPDRAERWVEGINLTRLGRDAAAEREICETQGVTFDEYQFNVVAGCTVAGHIDGSAPGIGKTAGACLAATRLARRAGNTSRCWIIGTLTAHGAWTQVKKDHAMSWVDYLKHTFDEVRVISVDSAHKFVAASPIGGVVIFDEAHLVGPASARMKACHRIRMNFDAGLPLTGTLLHAGVENTLSIYDLAIPGMSLFSSRWKAGEHFKCLVHKELGSRKVTALAKPSAEKEKFKAWLSRACVMLTVDSPEIGRRLWPEQHLHEVTLGEPWPPFVDLVADTALKIYDETGEMPHMQKVAHVLCRAGIEQKVDHFLQEIGDEPCVVFCNYRESLDYVMGRLVAAGRSYVRVDGDITGAPRLDAQRRFQAGDVQIFLGQMHAAGISLDLFRAKYSVAFDHNWSASDYTQALGRTARRGQLVETHHIDYVAGYLQARVVARLREAQDFNAECASWVEGRRALQALGPGRVVGGAGEDRAGGVRPELPDSGGDRPTGASGHPSAVRPGPGVAPAPLDPFAPKPAGKAIERLALGLPMKAEIDE